MLVKMNCQKLVVGQKKLEDQVYKFSLTIIEKYFIIKFGKNRKQNRRKNTKEKKKNKKKPKMFEISKG